MTDFNQAIILGNITKDPEMRYTPNGQAVINFSVATNRRWTNKETQQPQEEVEFHNIVAWGKLAEICSQILYKGRKVLVAGRLRTRNWEGQDGNKRYTTEIVADTVSATGQPKAVGENTIINNAQATASKEVNKKEETANIEQPTPVNEKKEEINLDDIPF